jgi:hypothetical protein
MVAIVAFLDNPILQFWAERRNVWISLSKKRKSKMSTQVPHETNHNAMAPRLYMVLELGKKLWKLAFSDGEKMRRVTIKAKNLLELHEGERLALVRQQIGALEAEQRRRERESDDPMIGKIVQLQQLGTIGPVSA